MSTTNEPTLPGAGQGTVPRAHGPHAIDDVVPLVYHELRELAQRRMSHEPAGQTLQATALVHEAFLRLQGADELWQDQAQLFAAAAVAMRRILVEKARARRSLKRGGALRRGLFTETAFLSEDDDTDYVALDAALERLSALDTRKGQVVSLRYFAGLTVHDTARALGISPATVKADWSYARAWLHRELTRG